MGWGATHKGVEGGQVYAVREGVGWGSRARGGVRGTQGGWGDVYGTRGGGVHGAHERVGYMQGWGRGRTQGMGYTQHAREGRGVYAAREGGGVHGT